MQMQCNALTDSSSRNSVVSPSGVTVTVTYLNVVATVLQFLYLLTVIISFNLFHNVRVPILHPVRGDRLGVRGVVGVRSEKKQNKTKQKTHN